MLQRRTFLIASLAAATPAFASAGDVPLPPSLDTLSNLPLERFDGAATTLGRHLRPGPSVISFWASWCAPCVDEARYLSTIRHRYELDRLNIIGLNVELVAGDEGVRRFLDLAQPTYTQLRANMSTYQAFGGAEQLNLPRLFVFDATGRPTAAFAAMNVQATNRAITNAVS
jgi:thiol-disulfide isomerase/thioredoxin